MTTIVGVWAGPGRQLTDEAASPPVSAAPAVRALPCVSIASANESRIAVAAPSMAAAAPSERLTPLALVSVTGGGGAAARLETEKGIARPLPAAQDVQEAMTQPWPLGEVPGRAASRLRLVAEQKVVAPPAVAQAAPPAIPGVAPAATGRPSPAPAAEASARPAVPAPDLKRQLFRKEALDAHYGADVDLEALAEPKRGAWTALIVLGSLVALLFIGAALLSIEVTVKAPGALRAPNGLRSVESVLSGAVTEVLAQAGDDVAAGQVVARLEETKLRSTLTLRESELALLEQDTREASQADEALLRSATRALERQRKALRERREINQAQLRQRSAHLKNLQELVKYGAASAADELTVNESVQAASESVAQLGSQVAQLELSMADRRREWQERDLERRASLSRANAAVEEAKSLLELVHIRAPADGRIESLLTTPGAVVAAGEILAQIVPKDAPRSIVAFLPSRETAFVKLGSEANVEVESLPVNEFGMARARVARISADVAKAEEIEAAFGEALDGSFVRVELSLEDDDTHDKMSAHLRSGERVLVRLHRRERRILSLLFEFVRKWLGQ